LQRTNRRARNQSLARQRQRDGRVDLTDGGEKMNQGLGKLALIVMEVIRQTLERQALRRMESDTLSPEEVERLGLAFMNLKDKMGRMAESFGMTPQELSTNLGALLKTGSGALDGASLVDVLDRLLNKGVVIGGQVKISVAEVDLVGLDLLAILYPIYGERRWLDGTPVSIGG
jgi:hypothetical protein